VSYKATSLDDVIDNHAKASQINAGRIVGHLEVRGCDFHVELLRVEDVPEPERSADLESQRAWRGDLHHGDWSENSEVYDDLQNFYEGYYRTFELPGREGRWVMVVHPFDD
jgi:hypothetical protein